MSSGRYDPTIEHGSAVGSGLMKIPKWIKSLTALLSSGDRRLALSSAAVGAGLASVSAHAASAQQPVRAHKEDIKDPIDSGFTKKNEKFVLTVADSFVMTLRGDTLRFARQQLADPAVSPPRAITPRAGHGSHYSHSSHRSHRSHSSHRSGGWS
jgi:hypothetical protein